MYVFNCTSGISLHAFNMQRIFLSFPFAVLMYMFVFSSDLTVWIFTTSLTSVSLTTFVHVKTHSVHYTKQTVFSYRSFFLFGRSVLGSSTLPPPTNKSCASQDCLKKSTDARHPRILCKQAIQGKQLQSTGIARGAQLHCSAQQKS